MVRKTKGEREWLKSMIDYELKVPCKDCKKRKLGCHSVCKDYKEFRKLKDIENQEAREGRLMAKASYSAKEYRDNFKNRFKR